MTNLVPLGKAGKNYFKNLVKKRFFRAEELMNKYDKYERMYYKGELKIVSYRKLVDMGYTGVIMSGICPVDDVTKYAEPNDETV